MTLLTDVINRVVNNVLPDPLLATTPQLDDRRQAFEGAGGDLQPFELTTIYLKR